MLLFREKPNKGTWFAWHPVWATESPDKLRPSGWVWLERVEYLAWDCWGNGGYTYTRLALPESYARRVLGEVPRDRRPRGRMTPDGWKEPPVSGYAQRGVGRVIVENLEGDPLTFGDVFDHRLRAEVEPETKTPPG